MGFIISCTVFSICTVYLIYLVWSTSEELKKKDMQITKLKKEIDKKDSVINTMMDQIKNTENKARKILESLEKING